MAGAPPVTSTSPTPGTDTAQKSKTEPPPVPVKVIYKPGSAFDMLKSYLGPLIAPLGVAALVIVFVIFILLQLEDLRDRVIHLIGKGHLRITTQAVDEAVRIVSGYLLAATHRQYTYGFPVGIGLDSIGIPNAILWGLLATLLRFFIPYPRRRGLPSAFPIFALPRGGRPGRSRRSNDLDSFSASNLFTTNVLEPWLYGASTGLSPMAVMFLSAAFWTWLWAPAGLSSRPR